MKSILTIRRCFPSENMYDRAHGTLEGLSAPYGTVADVAPQGLKDLGTTEDTGPVGAELGDEAASDRLEDDVTPAVDEATHITEEQHPSLPGAAAAPDPPVLVIHEGPDMSHIPTERPDNLPEFIPWPYPAHWRVRPKAQEVIHRAEQLKRPDGLFIRTCFG